MSDPSYSPDWQQPMLAIAEGDGDFLPLGQKHYAFFAEERPELLVTFEDAATLREREDKLPEHYALAKARGWSILTILAEGETWWRDPAVFRYFDRLADDGFLEDFDRVVFYGAGPAGYAAAAYSITAPQAELVLIAPRATLDPALAGWDERHRIARRINFRGRYGYAPDMTESASRVWLIHDPLHQPDAMHAALFQRPWVTPLNARYTAEGTEDTLREMKVLDRIIEAAMEGKMSEERFSWLWRARRSNGSYLRAVLAAARLSGHPKREIKICRSVTARLNAPRFARRLAELTGETV
ncbi:phosphoadenosine phosphosulfate reductase [Rhodobacter sp. SY28-1]|uniref:phosphoadenosine phosphosulfate reductase n=1 Tax=Rhodobacter sp. SY28-1 TaxID=2562317 RepID=UPI0010C1409D|nr:phosphoadenosine phosphosulfate reductase [Rhodobacter sp. SY28-1]